MSDVKRYNSNAGIGQKVPNIGGNEAPPAPNRVAPVGGNEPKGESANKNLPTGGNFVQGSKVVHEIGGKG